MLGFFWELVLGYRAIEKRCLIGLFCCPLVGGVYYFHGSTGTEFDDRDGSVGIRLPARGVRRSSHDFHGNHLKVFAIQGKPSALAVSFVISMISYGSVPARSAVMPAPSPGSLPPKVPYRFHPFNPKPYNEIDHLSDYSFSQEQTGILQLCSRE